MNDTLLSLLYRIGGDLPAVIVELALIGLCVNWCASVLEGTRGTRPLRGVLIILVAATMLVRIVAAHFGWVRLELLYRYVLVALALIVLVVFQPELRRAVIRVGDVRFHRARGAESLLVAALVKAAGFLSRNRYGALIAIQRDVDLTGWAENGTMINAEVSANLLNTIFYPGSPLHDLGVIIRGTRVIAANCQFPSPDSDEIDAALGSRHLAAVGMSYETDALVLVVSEESGIISLADNGKLTRYLTLDDLASELATRLGPRRAPGAARTSAGVGRRMWRYLRRALLVVPLSGVIWYLADQATLAQTNVRVALRIQHEGAEYVVDFVEPHSARPPDAARTPEELQTDSAVLNATFIGPARAIDALRIEASSQVLKLNWMLSRVYAQKGAHELRARELKDVIDGLHEIASRGLTVDADTLGVIRFTVDRRVTTRLRIQPDSGETPIAVQRVDPAEATVVFREGELERALGRVPDAASLERFASEYVVRAPLGELLSTLGPDDIRTVDVVLDAQVAGARAAAISPRSAALTIGIVAQRRTIENVVVHLYVSPDVLSRYDVDKADLNEWRIDLEVAGKEARLRGLGSSDIRAFVHVTSDMVPAADQPPEERLRLLNVNILTPEGVSVVEGRTRTVRVNLIPRAGPVP